MRGENLVLIFTLVLNKEPFPVESMEIYVLFQEWLEVEAAGKGCLGYYLLLYIPTWCQTHSKHCGDTKVVLQSFVLKKLPD